MSIREVRFLKSTEVRAVGGSGDSDPLRIDGYASVFNVNAQLPGFQERMKPGSFTRAIKESQDVVCLFNHDANFVLGRTTSGTLRLDQTERGLHYICDLPNTQTARDLHESIKRGDINGCSFAFTIPEGGQDWSEGRSADGTYFIQREISDVDLLDVSPVTYPCYTGTSVDARCAEAPVELRSAVAAKNEALKTVVVVPPAVIPEKREEDSLEEAMQEISTALDKAFPQSDEQVAEAVACHSPYYSGRFYVLETYINPDAVIAVEQTTGEYFRIPYTHDESKLEGEEVTFGEPQPVEKTWVLTDRAAVRNTEFRTKFPLIERKKNEDLSEEDSEEATDEEIDNEYDISDRDKIQSSYERLNAKGMDYPKRDYVLGRIKKAADAMGYECKEAEVVSSASAGTAGRAQERFAGSPEQATNHQEHAAAAEYHDGKAVEHEGKGETDAATAHKDAAEKHRKVVDSKASGSSDESKAAREASKSAAAAPGARSFEPFTKEEREQMAKDLARTFDPDCTSVRYSEDQPRDDHGRFGSGTVNGERAQTYSDHRTARADHKAEAASHRVASQDADKNADAASETGKTEAAKAYAEAANAHAEAAASHENAANKHTDASIVTSPKVSSQARAASRVANAASRIANAASDKANKIS